jgi:hypothetical protein
MRRSRTQPERAEHGVTLDAQLLAFAEDPGAFVRNGPDEERVVMDAAVVTFAPGRHFWSTTVTRVRFEDGAVASRLEEVRRLMRERGRSAAAWSIGPSATPREVVSELVALGLDRESPSGSTILLLTHAPDVRTSTFEVRVVRTYEDHRASIEVASEAFEFSPEDADDERRRARETFEAEQAGGHTARLLALDEGRAVATGRAWFAPQGIYLGGGATIASYRRRGAMGSLVAAAWAEAVRRSTPALVTSAGDMSTSPLRRMGFETVGRIDHLIDHVADQPTVPSGT